MEHAPDDLLFIGQGVVPEIDLKAMDQQVIFLGRAIVGIKELRAQLGGDAQAGLIRGQLVPKQGQLEVGVFIGKPAGDRPANDHGADAGEAAQADGDLRGEIEAPLGRVSMWDPIFLIRASLK